MNNETLNNVTVTTQLDIPKQRISDMLCTAFEGGSNYWMHIGREVAPSCNVWWKGNNDVEYTHLYYPLNLGGSVEIVEDCGDDEDDPKTHVLDLAAIHRGITLMAVKYPSHWDDFMSESDDADTADVFLQLCVLGEVVYG